MKKILGISLVALFAVSPIMAKAAVDDPVAGQPAAQGEQADNVVKTTVTPKFAVATEATTDVNVASAGYVKGAYNAAIRAVNKVYDDLDDKITSATLTEGSAIDIDEENKINVMVDDSTVSIGASGVQIKDGGVDTAQLATSAVTSAKIANDAVTSAAIATGAVGSDEIAANAVTTAKILDSNVTADKLATSAVTTAKIADSNVTADKLATSAVTFAKIDSAAVSSSITSASTNTELATAKAVYDAIDDLATQSGVEQTIKNTEITVTNSMALSGDVTATGAGSIIVMNDWNNASSTTTHSYIGGVNNTIALSGTVSAAVADSTVDYTE